jgi:hypothetical protein
MEVPMSDEHGNQQQDDTQYEPPTVEDLDTTEGPSVTAAGITVIPS